MQRSGTTVPPPCPGVPLTRAECLAKLAAGGHGRLAATMRAIPVIVPVSFTLFGEDVVFRPSLTAGPVGTIANSVVAFETDQAGPDGLAHWDVHVTGVAMKLSRDIGGTSYRLSSEIISGWRAGS